MSDTPRLTDDDLARIEAAHGSRMSQLADRAIVRGCHRCRQQWPCDAVALLAELRAARAALTQARDALLAAAVPAGDTPEEVAAELFAAVKRIEALIAEGES